jgi:peptidylprolyl isomerase
VVKPGKGGPHPKPTDTVRVNYTGWQTDGKMFDSSVTRGQPSEFSLQGVIKGWTDGLQVMSVGDKVRFWIPEELAYKGQPGKPQGMLVFDIELLEIKAAAHPDMPPPHHPPPPQ